MAKGKGVGSRRRVLAAGRAVPNLHPGQAADRRAAVQQGKASLPIAERCLRYITLAGVADSKPSFPRRRESS